MGFTVTPLAQKARTKTLIADSDLNLGNYDLIATDVKGDTAEFSEFVGGVGNFERLEFPISEPSGYNPIGTIIAFGSINVPEKWLSCNGTAVSRETYSELFNVIGVSFGEGDGITTFNLPDLNSRTLRGSTNIGSVGGSDIIVLTTENLPAHSHDVGTLITEEAGEHYHTVGLGTTGSGGSHSGDDSGRHPSINQNTSTTPAHSHTISGTTAAVGNDSPVDITNPYVGINFIIRAL